MEPKNLVYLPRGTLLSKVVQQSHTDAFLSPSVYRIDSEMYLNISLFRPGGLEKDPRGPFITGIVLAASDGAVRRALLMEIESDDGSALTVPAEFLPSEGAVAATYGDILRGLKNDKPKVCQETAAYRIASGGEFIHRIIETERFSFFFRNPEHDDSDAPYVIIRKLV